jgi:outer membrane protein OmpA-like peptidoglycan-associated protein
MMQKLTRKPDKSRAKTAPAVAKPLARPSARIAGWSSQRTAALPTLHALVHGPMQARLVVGPANDRYEQEADRVAEHVVHMRESAVATPAALRSSVSLQRKCACGGSGDDECTCAKGGSVLQRTASGDTSHVAPPIVHQVLGSPGQPLHPETRAFFEPRFGHDFSAVRVHTDALAAESARAVHARAYTVGSDMAFASGQYSPQSAEGRRLLGHELTHVVQQASVSTPPLLNDLETGDRHDAYERDADQVAEALFSGTDAIPDHFPITAIPSRPRLSHDWASCDDPPECPAREPGELTRAATARLQVGALDAPETGEIVYGFGIGSSSVASVGSDPTWSAFVAALSGSTDHWEILGFTDCEGATDGNTRLRQDRANAARAALPAAAQALIDRAVGASVSDCVASNDSEENRSFNRSVVFRRTSSTITMTDENITVSPPPLTTPTQDCTASNNSEIAFALPIARNMVSHAIDVLGRPSSTAVDDMLDKYFNDHSASTYLHVLSGYRNLSSIAGSFTIECEQPGSFMYDHFCGGIYAYVWSHGANVHLCGAAFGRSAVDLAETIVHESSHKFDNTDDKAYCWGGCPATLSRWSAYDNADSFSKFAWDASLNIP